MNEAPETSSSAATDLHRPKKDSVALGVGVGALILAAHVLFLALPLLQLAVFFPGVIQWFAVIPLAIVYRRQGRSATVKGLLLTAGVVTLLNATCCGILLYQL